MIGAVIVSHGKLSLELLEATQRIVGQTESLQAVALDWDDVKDARRQIEQAIEAVDTGRGVRGG